VDYSASVSLGNQLDLHKSNNSNPTRKLGYLFSASYKNEYKYYDDIAYGEYQRLGGEETLWCDVRVVAATNVDLPARAAEGRFRADLLDRLAFDVITLAPLRARPGDIELLAEHFGQRIARELEGDFPGWSRAALDAMREHDWHGNVRELKNAAERATFRTMAAQANGAPLGPVMLSRDALDPFHSPWRPSVEVGGRSPQQAAPSTPLALAPLALAPLALAPPSEPAPAAATPAAASAPAGPIDFDTAVRTFERNLLETALAAANGHQRKAADRLGLSYHQMRGLLRKYGYGRKGDGAEDETAAPPAR
jgi:psp operon transcriptional activator